MTDNKQKFIEFMQESGSLMFGDFVTKSGRNTPYFINTGKYSTGTQIAKLGEFYAQCILDSVSVNGKLPENTVLFGPAYKGIPLVIAVSIALARHGINAKYTFNRKEEKDHGEGGVLVGHSLGAGDSVLIIEDVLTAGTAVREILPIIENSGAKAAGLVISVNRMERGQGSITAIQELWNEYSIPTYALVTAEDILAFLHGGGDSGMTARMEKYMGEYCVR